LYHPPTSYWHALKKNKQKKKKKKKKKKKNKKKKKKKKKKIYIYIYTCIDICIYIYMHTLIRIDKKNKMEHHFISIVYGIENVYTRFNRIKKKKK